MDSVQKYNFTECEPKAMSAHARLPSCRSLDIYRLVVARGQKQATVAAWFNVTPARISQLVSRVRGWVNDSIGNWLFPGRDDLRFYVALECERIRVEESPDDPEYVTLTAPDWTYTRRITPTRSVSEGCDLEPAPAGATSQTPARTSTNAPLNISPEPLNSPPSSVASPPAASAYATTDFIPSHIHAMALRLAELLMVWQRTRKVSNSVRVTSG